MKDGIKEALENAGCWVDEHKFEIIGTAAVIGTAVVFKNGYNRGCLRGAVKVLEALENVNPETYRALMDEAISKGATVRF